MLELKFESVSNNNSWEKERRVVNLINSCIIGNVKDNFFFQEKLEGSFFGLILFS